MDRPEDILELKGEMIGELLDQDEFPSKIGNVAAVSDQQICFLRRDRSELTGYRYEYFDMSDCRSIEYRNEHAWYRNGVAGGFFIGAAALVYMLLTSEDGISADSAPVFLMILALITIGARFATSTHRHVIRFDMPEETLFWRSPPVDFEHKEKDALAVIEFARQRGILRETEPDQKA
jgi:hypothetical protein